MGSWAAHAGSLVAAATAFLVTDHGSIVAIRPLTDEAGQWLDDNVAAEGWQ